MFTTRPGSYSDLLLRWQHQCNKYCFHPGEYSLWYQKNCTYIFSIVVNIYYDIEKTVQIFISDSLARFQKDYWWFIWNFMLVLLYQIYLFNVLDYIILYLFQISLFNVLELRFEQIQQRCPEIKEVLQRIG